LAKVLTLDGLFCLAKPQNYTPDNMIEIILIRDASDKQPGGTTSSLETISKQILIAELSLAVTILSGL
jgi:hypothetical protein